MAAKLATLDEHLLAYGEGSSVIPDGGPSSSGANEQPQIRRMQLEAGYLSPFFITDPERMEAALENVYILIHQGKISSKEDLLPLLDQIKKNGKPLLIIAGDIEGEALATLVVKNLSGLVQVAAVSAPRLGDQRNNLLQDIALLTGGKAITEGPDSALKNIQISDLGRAKKVVIDKNHTVIERGTKRHQLCSPGPRKNSTVADLSKNTRRECSSVHQTIV